MQRRTVAHLGVVVCIWTFALMMLGGYVKSIGAGLSCPDWPSCYGQWFPPFPSAESGGIDPATGKLVGYTHHEIMSEWSHRLVAALLGPVLIGFAILAWRQRDAGNTVRYLPFAGIGILFLQYVVGGLTVLNLSEPILVVTHLGTATLFFGMMVVPTTLLYAGSVYGHKRGRSPDGVWRDPEATSALPETTATRTEHTDLQATHGQRTLGEVVGDYVSMTKPRVMGLLVLTSVTAMIIADGGIPALWPTVGVILGGMLATGGAGAINHFLERDLDRQMERTRDRPVATGRVAPGHALTFGITLGTLAFFITEHLANLLAAFFVVSGLLFYVLVYTMWLKRTTSLNIVIGGAAGGFPALVGWAAATGTVGAPAWLFFMLIVMWTPPHFWALALVLKDDYGRAGVPMLPSVKGVPRTTREILAYTVVTVALSFGFFTLEVLGRTYLLSAAVLGGLFLVLALNLHQSPSKRSARALFGYSIVYLGLLYTAAFVDIALP